MDIIKKIIDDTISSLQLPNDNRSSVSGYISVVIESIIIHLLKIGHPYVASVQIKEHCNNRRYTTSKMVLLVDRGSYIYYIITFHVQAGAIWKITCKRSHYNEVMDIAHNNGYVWERCMTELEKQLYNQLRYNITKQGVTI